jgi:subtilisin family serine protease
LKSFICQKNQSNIIASWSLKIVLVLFSFTGISQTEYHFVVKFNSKSNTVYSIDSPEDYLSIKAIDRRDKHQVPVSFEDLPVDSSNLKALKGFKLEAKSKWFNLAVINSSDSLLATQLSINSFIDTVIYIGSKGGINKRVLKNWDYGVATTQTNMVNGEFLHQKGYTGKGVLIGVIDVGFSNVDIISGFDSLHFDNRLIATYDFVENEQDVFDDPSHGTSVLSTISSLIDSHMIGTAPHSDCILLVSEDNSQENLIEEFYYIEAVEFADSCGVDVINTSLGYNDFDTPEFSHNRNELNGDSAWISKATNIASRKGILMVTSAGNSGTELWRNLTFPADADSALSVGAVDMNEDVASFSSLGLPSVHNTVKPNVVAQGKNTSLVLGNGAYVTSNGTSFSSPQITGWAACLMQAFPNETTWRIKKAIEYSSHQYYKPDSLLGYGIPNFKNAYYYLKYDGFNETDNNSIDLFPNPTSGKLTLVSSLLVDEIKVFDSKGALVFTEQRNGNVNSFDFNFLNAGYYFVHIGIGGEIVVKKIMKI